jgi:hypothetical protein
VLFYDVWGGGGKFQKIFRETKCLFFKVLFQN